MDRKTKSNTIVGKKIKKIRRNILKTIKADLSKNLRSIELHTIADTHIGDKNCALSLVKDRIKYIADTDNAFAILNGDIMNMALKTSVSDIYSERMTPMQQIKFASELLKPIKDKIIAMTSGNHEDRAYKTDGIDIMNLVARELGIESKYSNGSAVIFLRFGELAREKARDRRVEYTIYVQHGSGGGRKEGAKVARLADMASIIDTDIYIHSHTHLPVIMKQGFFRVYIPNSSVANVDKLFINTGSTLTYGGYGEKFEFKPNSMGTPVIYLSGIKKEFNARL